MAEKRWRFESNRSWQELGQSFQRVLSDWRAPLLYRPLTRLEFERGADIRNGAFAALDAGNPPQLDVVAVAKHSTSGGRSYLELLLYERGSGTVGQLIWNKGLGSFAKGLDQAGIAALSAADPSIRFTRA